VDQRQWLGTSYPPEVSWHLRIRLNSLRPGLWGALGRIFSDAIVHQWSVLKAGRLAAVVSWQSLSPITNTFWLAAPPDSDDTAVENLLQFARSQVPARRSLTIDYPAHQSSAALQAAGFVPHQTLIWMKINLQ
jgi:hypothetical protein